MVDRAAEPVSGKIMVASVNGEHTVKRIRREAEGVWLGPDAELHVFRGGCTRDSYVAVADGG